jgi:hypothetical protein
MKVQPLFIKYLFKTALLVFICLQVKAQPITGIWKGKLGDSRVELKLIRKGDSLIGTSYYYDSKSNYRRYSVKGYFDDKDNDVIWWDDVLIEEFGAHRNVGTGPKPLLAVADFNCPGEGVMKLDGKSSLKDDVLKEKRELHLVKGNATPLFPDEWDFLIDNYAYGVNHPEIVDSIEQIAFNPESASSGIELTKQTPPEPIVNSGTAFIPRPQSNAPVGEKMETINSSASPSPVYEKTVPEKKDPMPPAFVPPSQQTNEERYTNTTKILQNVIPLKGDSIELRFYDNAEIDGDSIAVFLNGHLLKEHILLAEQAYIMKLAVSDLQPDNELVMVAENLGTIPPNTSLMVAVVGDKKYEAHLESTMGSSALVRLVKP